MEKSLQYANKHKVQAVREPHHCKHCGKMTIRWKYCTECSPIVDKEKGKVRNQHYRDRHYLIIKHRNDIYRDTYRDETRQRGRIFVRTHKDKCKRDLENWRKKNPDKVKEQRERAHDIYQRRFVDGYCFICGQKVAKSSMLGLCQFHLFKHSDELYKARMHVDPIAKQNRLVNKFKHLVPDDLHPQWADEFIDLQRTKFKLGIIDEAGQKREWSSSHIYNIFAKYSQELRSQPI